MDKAQNCAECEFTRMYDYGSRIYYCDHVDRIDDMGKLGVGKLPETSPGWCPLMCKRKNNSSALIKMHTDTDLTDKYGNPIEIRVPEPEYMPEIFGKL